MRHALLLLTKVTISILLLYLSLRWVDVGALGARLSQFESGWIVLALFLLTVQVVLLAVRWRNIGAACGAKLPFISTLQISFIATFFNHMLPSTVGGDGVRIWFARKSGDWTSATLGSLVYSCWHLLLSRACHPRTLSFTIRSRARSCWRLEPARSPAHWYSC